jgi:WD40 repeat protein
VWDTTTGALLRQFTFESNCLYRLQFHPTDSSILGSTDKGFVKQWDVDSGDMKTLFEGSYILRYSPDGKTIATTSFIVKNNVVLLDAVSGTVKQTLVGHHSRVFEVTWSPGGDKVALVSRDDRICYVWDTSTGAILNRLQLGYQCGCKRVCSLSWGRDWVQDTQKALAFAMGQHPRLGTGSRVFPLEAGLVKMIVDRIFALGETGVLH